ncbi:alpha/beta fold hydrolase [Streptomyces sp. NPDC086091]|uniref:alpha/beta fold hydrolase n=1 Tax=Streptomyces sp. NPDC086091 TaxID=3365751 RepID=UPI0037F1F406
MKFSKPMIALSAGLVLAATGAATTAFASGGDESRSEARITAGHGPGGPKPTIVLLHGAFEDASAYGEVTRRLQRTGYPVIAPAIPLRGLAQDTRHVSEVVAAIDGPVVLVGHSYGGMIISQVAAEAPNVRGLVYASAFIPEKGESLGELNGKFAGSLLGPDTTYTVNHAEGPDLYVKAGSFRAVLAGDRSARDAAVAAASQRPVAASALEDKADRSTPDTIRKYSIIPTRDKAIPPAAQDFMSKRANARVWKVRSAHDVITSQPALVTSVIERAAADSR